MENGEPTRFRPESIEITPRISTNAAVTSRKLRSSFAPRLVNRYANTKNTGDDFLGRHVAAVVTNKLCGLDIDDLFDFQVVESVLKYNRTIVDDSIDGTYLDY